MKFKVEQKGQFFLVFNETTGDVKGRYKSEGEAKVQQQRLQTIHDEGVSQLSGTKVSIAGVTDVPEE